MNDFLIDYTWEDGEGIERPEFATTFAMCELRIGSNCLTQAIHKRSKTLRSKVLIPLYPLAEWLVGNWWVLNHEAELPERSSYGNRHSFIQARQGYCFPDVRIIPEGHQTRIEWHAFDYMNGPIAYIAEGAERVLADDLVKSLASFVEAVDERLQVAGMRDTWLQREWYSVQKSINDDQERVFCTSAGWLGVDPYDISEDQEKAMEELCHKLPQELREDTLRAAIPEEITRIADWVNQTLAMQEEGPETRLREKLPALHGAFTPDCQNRAAWEAGYLLAQEVRRKVNVSPASTTPLEDLCGQQLPIVPVSDAPSTIDRLVIANGNLYCITDKKHRKAQRFLVARCSCRLLHTVERQNTADGRS